MPAGPLRSGRRCSSPGARAGPHTTALGPDPTRASLSVWTQPVGLTRPPGTPPGQWAHSSVPQLSEGLPASPLPPLPAETLPNPLTTAAPFVPSVPPADPRSKPGAADLGNLAAVPLPRQGPFRTLPGEGGPRLVV